MGHTEFSVPFSVVTVVLENPKSVHLCHRVPAVVQPPYSAGQLIKKLLGLLKVSSVWYHRWHRVDN